MINVKKYISKKVSDKFTGNKNITPEQWEDFVINLNKTIVSWIAAAKAVIAIVIVFILFLAFGFYSQLYWSFVVGIGIFIYTITTAVTKSENVITVPNGYKGVVVLFGNIKGNYDEPLLFTDGSFRQIANIPLVTSNMLAAVKIPKKLPSFDYKYENVLSSDSVPFSGTHSFFGVISNPFTLANFVLSTGVTNSAGFQEVKNMIEEISLRAMKDAYDELNHADIIGHKGTENLMEKYQDAITDFQENRECTHSKCDFFTHQHHPDHGHNAVDIEQLGITGSFLIKTSILPSDLQKTYTDFAGMPTLRKNEEQKAEIEANFIRKKGEATVAVEESLIDMRLRKFNEAFIDMADAKGIDKDKAAHLASLVAEFYGEEKILSISGPDGKQLGNEMFGMLLTLGEQLSNMSPSQRKTVKDSRTK